MLKKIWCVPVATWFIPIATLAYRCSKVSSFTFVICFVSKVMPYFTSTVLCLLISGALVVSSVWSIGCSVVTFYRLRSNLGSTATYRCILQLNCAKCAKLWYRTVWNIINTGTFPVPVYRASLEQIHIHINYAKIPVSTVSSCVSIHLFSCVFWNIALKNTGWKRQDAHKF